MAKLRQAVVAGQFYPAQANELRIQIGSLIDSRVDKQNVIACMLPHAGYAYSGKVAALTISAINVKDRIILLGPNHTGYGAQFSIMTDGTWETPLGRVEIDSDLAKKLLGNSEYLKEDALAHTHEHSLEVELPFLQYFKPAIRIVPISFMSEDIEALKSIGRGIAEVIRENRIQSSTLIVASSDMTHYESQLEASNKDAVAIRSILDLDEQKLALAVKKLDITMCGYAPVITMISAAKALGAKSAKLIKYQTSGDVTGDTTSVVGYAGITIY